MTNSYRAMCAELLAIIPASGTGNPHSLVVARARALLDQQKPEGPTDRELRGVFLINGAWPNGLRAVADLAADRARWGRPTPQPPADDEAAELAAELRHFVAEYQQMRGLDPENIYSIQQGDAEKEAHLRISRLTRIADLLEHPTPR